MGYTKYSRRLHRRIGGTIVRLTESHVVVWRAGNTKKKARVALSEMLAALDRVRPPRGWVPQIGEEVATGGNHHRARVQAVIPAVPEALVRVRYPRGHEKLVGLSEITPAGDGPVLVLCERTPQDGTTE